MFANHNVSYMSNDETLGGSFSTCPSTASSFSSDGSSSSWESDMVILTPTSTPRRGSPASVKLERTPSEKSTATCSPNRFSPKSYDAQTAFRPKTSMARDMMSMSSFNDPSIFIQGDMSMMSDQGAIEYGSFNSYNSLSNGLQNGLSDHLVCDSFQGSRGKSLEPPALDMHLYFPDSGMESSPVSEDFVIPSQTTFINASDLQSPLVPVKSLHFDLSYESPQSPMVPIKSLHYGASYQSLLSEVDPYFTMDEIDGISSEVGSMAYYAPMRYNESKYDPKSASTTPSCSSPLRQNVWKPLPTTAALQRIQGVQTEDFDRDPYPALKESKWSPDPCTSKQKRLKREAQEYLLAGIKIQKQARKKCMFEGCFKKFERAEHLKRHEKIHALKPEVFHCVFCNKPFKRSDNLKSHIWLHAQPEAQKKSRRTVYCEDAMEVYLSMGRKRNKGLVGTDGKVKSEGGKQLRSRVTEH